MCHYKVALLIRRGPQGRFLLVFFFCLFGFFYNNVPNVEGYFLRVLKFEEHMISFFFFFSNFFE